MPEYHPGTDVEIPDNVPTSEFRNAIPNAKRYMKHNNVSIADVAEAARKGAFDKLDQMLASGDEKQLFNGDLNQHVTDVTALHMAAMTGQTECVELMLRAKADPHVRATVGYGEDPEEGKSAQDLAKEHGWDDTAELLAEAEKKEPYGWYLCEGPGANAKIYTQHGLGKRPEKGWYFKRPGAAVRQGLDPKKYGGYDLEQQQKRAAKRTAAADVARSAKPAFVPLAEPPLPIGLLFPGQGSQYVKMMATVKDIPKVKEYCEKAKEVLGFDVLEVCAKGPESQLEKTSVCQPVMFIAGLAGVEKLRAERPEAVQRAQVLAGLSLGEYTALCVAGVFSFEDGLRLVKLRGEAMQEAAEIGKQAMLSVAGLEKDVLMNLCQEAVKKESGGVCQIANELFPKGFSCAGTEKAITALKDLAEKAGALQAKLLKTSGAFHTPLMAPAQQKLGRALDEILPAMSPPKHTVYMNATAEPLKPGTDPVKVVELLKKQLTSSVLWEPSVRAMIAEKVGEFYEVGPMKQLKAMMKRIDTKVWAQTKNVEV